MMKRLTRAAIVPEGTIIQLCEFENVSNMPDRAASARAAGAWQSLAYEIAPQVSEEAALNPYGPRVIASRPVPDTPANRARL